MKTNKKLALAFLLFFSAIILVWIAIYFGNKPRYIPEASTCAGNLKQIGLALRMYSQAYDGYFPPYDGVEGLEIIRKLGYLETRRLYQCDRVAFNKIQDDYRTVWGLTFLLKKEIESLSPLTENCVHYHYRGGLKKTDSVDSAIAWDKPGNHDRHGNVLFLDGHVESFAGANWMDNIK